MTDFVLVGYEDGDGASEEDGNVDVRIEIADGRVYVATFFTVSNLSSLLKQYRVTGECAAGTYVWAKDMIVVESIGREVISRAVADMIRTNEIEAACTRLK